MKNLTAEQKSIVNTLVNHFSKLNETKSVGTETFTNGIPKTFVEIV